VDVTHCPNKILNPFEPARGPLSRTHWTNKARHRRSNVAQQTTVSCKILRRRDFNLRLGRTITQIVNLVGRTHKLSELVARKTKQNASASGHIRHNPHQFTRISESGHTYSTSHHTLTHSRSGPIKASESVSHSSG